MFRTLIGSIILLPVILLGAVDPFAKKMNYLENYQEAKELSIAKFKPMMVVVGTVTCPWCKKFENQTLKKDTINKFVQLHFTPVKLTKDKDLYPKKLLDAKVVPTVFFVDPKSDHPFYISRGYKHQKKFLLQLQEAKKIYYNKGLKR